MTQTRLVQQCKMQQAMTNHDMTQINTWQDVTHGPMIVITIWMYDRNFRISKVSTVR